MSLTEVKMSEEAWLTCLTHSLSTETEEIMGLLLGDIEYSKNERGTAIIWGASPQSRSDRRKDRVETTPEQLAAASAQAERMTVATGRTTRVIGWYHSHPHITVFPSHVDVRTQAMYQLLDTGFIGLIFSCFSEDMNKVGRIQVIAFQSLDGKQNNASRHVAVSPVSAGAVIDIESSSSYSGDVSVTSESTRAGSLEQDTADSKGGIRSRELGSFFANSDANNNVWKGSTSDNLVSGSNNSIIDVDPLDMSESMQEAMHRSTLDISGAEYVRKEVPLSVLPASNLLKLDSPLASYTDLQRVMYEEERSAYNQAIVQNMRNGEVHPLTFIHHTATYQASLCKLIEYCLSPALNALQDRSRENEVRLKMLNEEAKVLEAEIQKGSASSSRSPRKATSQTFRRSPSSSHRENQSPFDSSGMRAATGPSSRNRT